MTATDELRALLDERGVEWSATVGAIGTIWTHWDAFNGQRIHAMDNEDGTVEIFDQWNLTPAQAIAATLGVGTCHDMHEDDGYFKCSECGGRMYGWTEDDSAIWFSRPHFCPNCGRRIEVSDG